MKMNPVSLQFETLILEISEQIAVLTISRPQSLNALNSQVLREFNQALDLLQDELQKKKFSQLRCLLITGAGEKAFVAGADIKEMRELKEAAAGNFALQGQRTFQRLADLPIPVIAAVNGFALGGGLELALACDFIYAAENAKLGLPEVSLGLIPGFGGTVRLARLLGPARAKEMILTGQVISAQEALRIGLVNKVFALAELKDQCLQTAKSISQRGPLAIQHAKSGMQKAFDQDLQSGLQTELQEFASLFSTADFQEGTQAFLEKRAAQFTGN